jgi:hypothetical protein
MKMNCCGTTTSNCPKIKDTDTLNYQIMGVMIAAIVALVNAAFGKISSDDRCWILLSVYAVTVPGRFLIEVARARIWRIASYLEIFLEPEMPLVKWQQRLNKHDPASHRRTNIVRTEFWLMWGLDMVAGGLVMATVWSMNDIMRFSFLAAAIGFMLHSTLRAGFAKGLFDRGGKIHGENREAWRVVKDKEQLNRAIV